MTLDGTSQGRFDWAFNEPLERGRARSWSRQRSSPTLVADCGHSLLGRVSSTTPLGFML